MMKKTAQLQELKKHNILLKNQEVEKQVRICKAKPYWIWLESTTRCNLRCMTCSRSYSHMPGQDMSEKVFHRIRDEIFPALDYVELQGFGEPMLARNFDYFFQTAIDYEVKTGLITNGTRLSKAYLEAFVEHDTKLTVSIDGATERTYNHVRPRADFPALIGNLKIYKALRAANADSSSLLTVIFVAMRSNIEELPLMVDLCQSIGADRLVVANFVYFDVMPHELHFEKLVYHQELANEMFRQASIRAKSCNLQLDLPNLFGFVGGEEANEAVDAEKKHGNVNENPADHSPEKEGHEEPTAPFQKEAVNEIPADEAFPKKEDKKQKFYPNSCPDPWATAYVNMAGDILPCCAYHAPLGRLRTSSFEEIWNNFKYRDLRRRVNSRFPPLYCKECFTFWGINAGNPDKMLSEERGVYRLSTKLQRQFRKKETAIRIFRDKGTAALLREFLQHALKILRSWKPRRHQA